MSIGCLANEKIVVTRWSKTKLVGGKYKASKLPPIKNVPAGVQPLSGREREALPEGRRQSYVVKVYTDKELLIDDDQKKQRGDILEIDGEQFEVFEAAKFKGVGLDHWRSFAARLNKA